MKLVNLLADYQKEKLSDKSDFLISATNIEQEKLVVKSPGKVHFMAFLKIYMIYYP